MLAERSGCTGWWRRDTLAIAGGGQEWACNRGALAGCARHWWCVWDLASPWALPSRRKLAQAAQSSGL